MVVRVTATLASCLIVSTSLASASPRTRDMDPQEFIGGVVQKPMSLLSSYNWRLQSIWPPNSLPLPEGDLTYYGTRYQIPTGTNNCWSGRITAGANLAATVETTIPIGVSRVSVVHALINTLGGAPGPSAYVRVEFYGSAGAFYARDLVGNVDVRDWFEGDFTNDISSPLTTNAFIHGPAGRGQIRLDQVRFELPFAFSNQTLSHIRIVDSADNTQIYQRVILSAITAFVNNPVPGDLTLDGRVDFLDLLSLAQNYGVSSGYWIDGDFNSSGKVDFTDLLILAQGYGHGSTTSSAQHVESDWYRALAMVPEPASLLVALSGLGLLQRTRR